MFLRNVGICLQVHTALQPRRQTSTFSPPPEPHIFQNNCFQHFVKNKLKKHSNIGIRTIEYKKSWTLDRRHTPMSCRWRCCVEVLPSSSHGACAVENPYTSPVTPLVRPSNHMVTLVSRHSHITKYSKLVKSVLTCSYLVLVV
jgi:hypothetical protein